MTGFKRIMFRSFLVTGLLDRYIRHIHERRTGEPRAGKSSRQMKQFAQIKAWGLGFRV